MSSGRKALLVILTVIAVLVASVGGARQLPTAGAQSAAPVQFGQPSVTTTGGDPIAEGTQLTGNDRVKLTFPWTAQGSIQDGQTMTIAFPNEIALPGSNDAIPFSVGGNKAGECRVDADAQALNCRFNDSLSRLDAVSGSISLNVGLKEAPGPNWEFETEPGLSLRLI